MVIGLPTSDVSHDRSRTVARRLAWCAVGCALLSIAILYLIPIVLGVPDRMIIVTWRAIDDDTRVSIERRLNLSEATRTSGFRWSYVPADTRPETLREIVQQPAVEAADGIEPGTFTLSENGPLTARRHGLIAASPLVSRVAKGMAYLSGLAVCVLLLLAAAWRQGLTTAHVHAAVRRALERAGASFARVSAACKNIHSTILRHRPTLATARAALATAQRGVPVISAESAGLFRIVFGVAVLACAGLDPMSPEKINPYDLGGAHGIYGAFVTWLSREPAAVDSIATWLMAFGSLFIAGVATSISYIGFVLAFLAWASVRTLARSHHVVSSITIALICLIPARWSDAWSVDAWIRRRWLGRAPRPASRRYGFAPWALTVVLGVAFFAAALSKVRQGGAWILNGTVKYHFVTDLDQALVSWGPVLTSNHAVAVAASLSAVLVEATVITAAFTKSVPYRAACGLAAFALLSGFWLFQGVMWPGWWILLLGFFPWQWIRGGHHATPRGGSLTIVQWALVAALVIQQSYASWMRLEARPFISAYDMYSTTYASEAAYEAASNLRYRVVGVTTGGTVDLPNCEVDEPAARLFAAAAGGGSVERERLRGLIGMCVSNRPDVTMVGLEGDKKVYDWKAGRFVWKRGLDRVGPVPADWLRTENR